MTYILIIFFLNTPGSSPARMDTIFHTKSDCIRVGAEMSEQFGYGFVCEINRGRKAAKGE